MTILLYPNKRNPDKYRVLDKSLGIQEYFPFTPEGKRKAIAREEKIKSLRRIQQLRQELPIVRLFAENGGIKGLRRVWRRRYDRAYECFKLYACGQQSEVAITDDFEECFNKACRWLIEKHDIELTTEIKMKFRKAKRLYWSPAPCDFSV